MHTKSHGTTIVLMALIISRRIHIHVELRLCKRNVQRRSGKKRVWLNIERLRKNEKIFREKKRIFKLWNVGYNYDGHHFSPFSSFPKKSCHSSLWFCETRILSKNNPRRYSTVLCTESPYFREKRKFKGTRKKKKKLVWQHDDYREST